jgi:hypothetical protein
MGSRDQARRGQFDGVVFNRRGETPAPSGFYMFLCFIVALIVLKEIL